MKNSNDTSWDRTSDLPTCSTARRTKDQKDIKIPGELNTFIIIIIIDSTDTYRKERVDQVKKAGGRTNI